jgi:hypothetical protein
VSSFSAEQNGDCIRNDEICDFVDGRTDRGRRGCWLQNGHGVRSIDGDHEQPHCESNHASHPPGKRSEADICARPHHRADADDPTSAGDHTGAYHGATADLGAAAVVLPDKR